MTTACRKKFIFPMLLAFLIPATVGLFAVDEFDHPNSYIGNADWDGGLVLWVEVAQIPVEGGISVPLRLRFKSKGQKETSLFGEDWWCPLLEGTASLPKRHYIEYTALGGGGGYLARKSGFQSDDGRTKATLDGIEVGIESAGWVYRYKDGKITDAKTPNGTSLVWKNVGDSVRLEMADGRCVAEATRAGDEVKIVIPGLNAVFSLGQKRDNVGDPAGWALAFPDGRREEMKLERQADGVTRMVVEGSDGTRGIYRWKTETGDLLSDSDFSYEVRPTDIGRNLLNRVDGQGQTEWYFYDSYKGAATYKRQDGSRVVSWYDLKPGSTNMKVFRMDTLSGDQKLVSARLLSYTPEGALDKEWTEEGKSGSNSSKGVRFIALDEAMKLHAEPGALFIDARHPAAFRAGAIPGSVNLSRVNFERDYAGKDSLLKGAKTLVVYCTSRNCEDSSIVATKLHNLGFKNVLVFEGGWAEWWKHR